MSDDENYKSRDPRLKKRELAPPGDDDFPPPPGTSDIFPPGEEISRREENSRRKKSRSRLVLDCFCVASQIFASRNFEEVKMPEGKSFGRQINR